MGLLLRGEGRVDRPGIGIGVGAHGIRPDPQPLHQIADHQLAGDHTDRTGDRRRVGDDRVGPHRDVVAAGGGNRAHRRHHRLAAVAGPGHLAPDALRRGDRAAGTVHPQHDRGHRVVGAGLPQCRRDGVAADVSGAERQELRPTASVDDRSVEGDDGQRRLGPAAGNRWHGWGQPGAGRTGVARQVQPRRARCSIRNIFHTNQFRYPVVGFVAESDPVDQAGGHGVVAQQRGPVGQRVERLGVDLARFGDRLPHLLLQAFQHPGDGLAVRRREAVLGETVCRRLVLAARDELRLRSPPCRARPAGRWRCSRSRSARRFPTAASRPRRTPRPGSRTACPGRSRPRPATA